MPQIEFDILPLQTRHQFHIARASVPALRRNVWVRLRAGELEGWGEAAPNAFYSETADIVVAALQAYRDVVTNHTDDLQTTEQDLLTRLPSANPKYPPHPSARSAISAALLDLHARRAGLPVWQYLGLRATSVDSSFTIGIDEPELMRQKIREARSYSILKIKLGTARDQEVLELLREEAPTARLRVDANTGWSAQQAIALLPMLREYGVELIEQPLPADDYEGLASITRVSDLPIIADESCRVAADVGRLVGCVHGVNIKLAKCGSLLEAVRIAEAARKHNMQVMVGCMIESTLGIAAAIQLASLADYVDLDGAALLADDPFVGPHINERGKVSFNTDPGLGVTRKDA